MESIHVVYAVSSKQSSLIAIYSFILFNIINLALRPRFVYSIFEGH